MCSEHHTIDPCHTYSTPGLTWFSGLIFIGDKPINFKDTVGFYDIIQSSIIGGILSVLGIFLCRL